MIGLRPALLAPADFRDPARFAAERDGPFLEAWHVAGLDRDLAEPDDWIMATIAGREVVLQRFADGEIGAFSNICPHRFSAIRNARQGNGKLRCPYHLWSFDQDGYADAVPLRGPIALAACRTEALRLERWQVARCGALLFVAYRPSRDLAGFLGPLFADLEALSKGLGRETLRFEDVIEADWKIILQNTVELDHAFGVHRETFGPLLARPVAIERLEAASPHLSYRAATRPAPEPRSRAERRVHALFARAALPPLHGYRHATLFPSATLGTTDNRILALVRYQPLSAGRTTAEYRLFLPAIPDLSAVEVAILDQVAPVDIAFTRRLLEEDKQICEAVQRGVGNAVGPRQGSLMPGEALVAAFQEAASLSSDRAKRAVV